MLQTSEEKSTYITILSHDLKIPTIAQIRALELLLNGNYGTLNKEQKEIILLILDSCKYLYKVILTLVITCNLESNRN
jgi:light-regulated signal transduction histidine kinase (bacteriophytochrome)